MGGFIDPSIADSVNDIKKRMVTKEGFELSDKSEDADIVITVLRRESRSEVYGTRTTVGRGIFGGLTAITEPAYGIPICYIYFEISAGEITIPRVGYGGFWRIAAAGVSIHVLRWANSNREEIMALREEKVKE